MKLRLLMLGIFCLLFTGLLQAQKKQYEFKKDTVKFTREMLPAKYVIDTRIDNMGYWRNMAEAGLVPVAPNVSAPAPKKRTSKIMAPGFVAGNSPDIPVTTSNTTQSENSIFISPGSSNWLVNSNNSTPQPSTGSFYGTSAFYSEDSASTFNGQFQGTGGGNNGDPSVVISNEGRWFVNYITGSMGQGIAFSDNQGTSWTTKTISAGSTDKNHLWIDNLISSPYTGNLYAAWMESNNTYISKSTDNAMTWSVKKNISSAVNAGSHNQGVNLKTGPNGEVFAAWAIYDSWGPSIANFRESAIGFARSMDGGQTYNAAIRVIDGIQGIRTSNEVPVPNATGKNMRVNSFPSMAVDVSNGVNRGNIYIVWTNLGFPGINTGNDVDVYLIRSTDNGLSWSAPHKVNQDLGGFGKVHYLPWISCDPVSGKIAIVLYDDRNVSATQVEAWCAVSADGGETFTDFAVSDVAFTPSPVPNMATAYMGDYLSITVKNDFVYPCWTDTRLGYPMTYVSPFLLSPYMGQAYVAYQDHDLSDYSAGNNNGTPDYGENLLLTLDVKNIGDKADTAVMVTISCDSPLVTMTDSTEFYGNFEIGEIKSIIDGFAFHISDSVVNGTELVFNVKSVNNIDSVNYSFFTITAFAPELTISNISISDPLGNNNQVLDPGETAEITIEYTNNSLFDATHPVSHLQCAQSFVTIGNSLVSIPAVAQGQTGSATFQVTVASVPFGSAAQFTNKIDYSYQSSQKSFLETIGLIVEDWETVNFTKFPWTFSGDNDWEIDNATYYEGAYAARSKSIAHNQSASLNITYKVLYDDTISFYRKVSSELFHDVLSFYVDNVKIGQWSGNQNWKRSAYPITAGEHTFRWEYSKDAANVAGQDAAWVDFIVFPPETRTMVYAGNNTNSCENMPVQMNATATNYQSLQWSTSGSGIFSDALILNPVYTPSASDVAAGSVTLTLTVTGISFKETSQSSFVLTFNNRALANAGSDAIACEGTAISLSEATALYYSALSWSTSGNGVFSDPSSLTPQYTPGSADLASGSVMLSLTAVTGNACPPAVDTLMLAVNKRPQAALTLATEICRGDSTQLGFNLTGTAPFTVVFDNGESFTVPANEYQQWVSPAATMNYTIQSITDANGCTNTTPVSANILVKPSPVVNMAADTILCGNLTLNLSANAEGAVSYLWTPGNATTPTISIDTAGAGLSTRIYTMVAKGANGCTTTAKSTVSFKNCTGIEEMVGNVMFALYPNPNNGQFAIEFKSGSREEVNMKVVNASGATVFALNSIAINGNMTREFDLRNLARGTYMLVLENNKMQISRQLIIAK